jgi:hypothetical protein
MLKFFSVSQLSLFSEDVRVMYHFLSQVRNFQHTTVTVSYSIWSEGRGGLGSSLGQSMWDFWWAECNWDRLSSEFFDFTLSVSFHRGSPYSYNICGMNGSSVDDHS